MQVVRQFAGLNHRGVGKNSEVEGSIVWLDLVDAFVMTAARCLTEL